MSEGREMDEVNPYQAPESIDEPAESPFARPPGPLPYASRWLRLGGSIFDSLIVGVVSIPATYGLGFYDNLNDQSYYSMRTVGMSLLGIAIFLLLQGVLIYTRGQTLGKLLCGTVVVTRDFRRANGNRYLFLRLAPVWIISQIPLVGGFFGLADALLIFRDEKNCIHDDIAGTRVVMYRDLVGRSAVG